MSNADFPIENLSVPQKIDLMERLWVDLSRRPEDIPECDWHGDVLARRLDAVKNGDTQFTDWTDAKQRLTRRYE